MAVEGSPYEEHVMPNGSVVYYRDDLHTYHSGIRWDGKKWIGKGRWGDLPSPSTIAKHSDPDPEKLMGYVMRVQSGDLKPQELLLLRSAGVLGVDTELKADHKILKECKGAVGNIAHKAFELLLAGASPEELPEHPICAAGYVKGLIEFFNSLPEYALLQSEEVVYSEIHGFAGRFDARIAVPQGTFTEYGESAMIDLKSSNYIGRAAHNQLAGYKCGAKESGYINADLDDLRILQVSGGPFPDGKHYRLINCRGIESGFLANLLSYNDGKRIDRETAADWREYTK